MKDIPIIFSAPMVNALLDGRKQMTRRLAWREPKQSFARRVAGLLLGTKPTTWQKVQPGDRLWVRENIQLISVGPGKTVGIMYSSDPAPPGSVHFFEPEDHKMKLTGITPCIHMPRWASRLTLVVTAVKVERLNCMSNSDALAEGISDRINGRYLCGQDESGPVTAKSPVTAFAWLWNNLHGEDAWAQNPEVVVLTFTVHNRNIDAL